MQHMLAWGGHRRIQHRGHRQHHSIALGCNLPSLPGVDPRFDKPEGLALKPDGTLIVGFDNDFARVDGRPDNLLTAISL